MGLSVIETGMSTDWPAVACLASRDLDENNCNVKFKEAF